MVFAVRVCLNFPLRDSFLPLYGERESDRRRMCTDHETCDDKKQVFEMDPKQRERSALQSNFILQMMGFVKAETRAKCLECHCRPDKPNQQSHAVVCAHWHFELTSYFSLSSLFV